MGRKYYCDYCEKRIQNDSSIIRKHNEGLPHIRAKAEYFEQFKDVEQILSECKNKLPCRSLKDNTECMFGVICRYRHYTNDQIWEMQQQVEQVNFAQQKRSIRLIKNLRNVKARADQFILKRYQARNSERIPPSLQTINPETELEKYQKTEWG